MPWQSTPSSTATTAVAPGRSRSRLRISTSPGPLGDAVTAAPATSGTAYPVRAYTAGGATNLAPYYARTLRISIVQASTNANTYTVGVITR